MPKTFSILVADKNKNVRDFLKRELSAEGYLVDTARDGNQVLEIIIGQDTPDLLVLDLEIPGIESAVVFERAQTRIPPLPVIVHTFLTEESERNSGGTPEIYIEKSGNIDRLKSAITDVLKRFYPQET